jgi:imidazole glycerol-phosphate synthase subunit HisH
MIVIVNYGMGNLRSVQKAFERINLKVIISSDFHEIKNASHLVLPGVGHFAQGMENLKKLGLVEVLNEAVIKNKKPILGICLGMQLMTKFSDEGNVAGLGWIDAKTEHFNITSNKIPHMGWNNLKAIKNSRFLKDLNEEDFFYFVHSYKVVCSNSHDVLTVTNYGIDFHSSFEIENIIGVQFHPEKSHQEGLQLLKNFICL